MVIYRSIKQAVKRFIPSWLLALRKNVFESHALATHMFMDKQEVENWLKERYRKSIGVDLNLDNPLRYTEKIQWCKLHAMDSQKSILADKYAVRSWVANQIGEEYLIPLLGVWEKSEEIDFQNLPDAFVLKTNNSCGTNIIIKSKSELDEAAAKRQLDRWLDIDYGWLFFEPQYLSITPKIIAEQYISNDDGSEVSDYKFICFAGQVYFIRVDLDRHGFHTRVTFDLDWNVQEWCEGSFPRPEKLPAKPECFDELVSLVEMLAVGFGHVRVDFYVVNGRPLFGEMTFSSGGGFEEIIPDAFDFKLGELWDLSDEPSAELPYGTGRASGF